jgi:hypothetical protein
MFSSDCKNSRICENFPRESERNRHASQIFMGDNRLRIEARNAALRSTGSRVNRAGHIAEFVFVSSAAAEIRNVGGCLR